MTSTDMEQLRITREALGLTLADVAHETRIPAEKLRLIEEGKLASLGGMTYARSFLLMYAKYLGVDLRSVAEALPQAILGGVADYRYLVQSQGRWVPEGPPRKVAGNSPHYDGPITVRPVLKVAAMLVAIGALAIWWAIQLRQGAFLEAEAEATRPPAAVPLSVSPNAQAAWHSLDATVAREAAAQTPPQAMAQPEVRRASPVTQSGSVQ